MDGENGCVRTVTLRTKAQRKEGLRGLGRQNWKFFSLLHPHTLHPRFQISGGTYCHFLMMAKAYSNGWAASHMVLKRKI